MKNQFVKLVLSTFFLLTFSSHGFGQEKSRDAIYIIFDLSGSMWQKLPDGSFKIATAKKVLQDFVGGDFSGYALAFRAYGHRRKGDCRDSELADGLKKIQKQTTVAALLIDGVDAVGNRVWVDGALTRDGKKIYEVSSNGRNLVEAGEYDLIIGARTRNGNLYKPIRKTVRVALSGETTVKVAVAAPPSVRAKFVERGKEQPGAYSLIQAFQDGREVFSFRSIDEVYVDEGSYEFRTQPNRENDLSVTETFVAGDHKELVFKMVHTVLVHIKMVASGSGTWFIDNYELWQNGEQKYNVHVYNGAYVLPGTYDLHLPNRLTPYVKPGIIVTDEDEQSLEITVPAGHVTVIYQKADGAREEDKRCFIGRGPTGSGVFKMSGEKYPLLPGTYNVVGWYGTYERQIFEITVGDDKTIILQAKK